MEKRTSLRSGAESAVLAGKPLFAGTKKAYEEKR